MKQLKLQMQVSVDGYVAGPEGQLDWMTWEWDDELKACVNDLTDSIDTILMGKNMAGGFLAHWEKVVQDPSDPSSEFARKMVDAGKIIYSRGNAAIAGINATITSENLADSVNGLKAGNGKDMIVYGGANFVSSLLELGLIDELNLFVNPAALGGGMRIFKRKHKLQLLQSRKFDCGIILMQYKPIS